MSNKAIGLAEMPGGFVWGAASAGIKASGKPDVAVAVATARDAAGICAGGAATYTSNRVVAAPVTVGQRNLLSTGGRVGAVLVNSGNANCATGSAGVDGCIATCVAAAESFGCIFDEVIPSSTGIIGVPFPTEKVVAAMPALKASVGNTPQHAEAFAQAIMTTDIRMKTSRAAIPIGGNESPSSAESDSDSEVRIWGCAKGAGMIGPRLGPPVGPPHATMLVYLFTDIAADVADLRAALASAVEPSFNSISIDGDTSTNDTVLLLASRASGIKLSKGLVPAFDAAMGA